MPGKSGVLEGERRMTLAEERYPSVIYDIRKNMGLDEDDDSKDDQIINMPRSRLLERYLTWNGIIGYNHMIASAVGEIYGVYLSDDDAENLKQREEV